MVNKVLFLGGVPLGGGRLTTHNLRSFVDSDSLDFGHVEVASLP